MRDSDATALSLTRRQYHQILFLIDRLEAQYRAAAEVAGLPTDAAAMRRTLAVRRGLEAAARDAETPTPAVDSPIRRRVRAYLDRLRHQMNTQPEDEPR
jgi:hypothetical protein